MANNRAQGDVTILDDQLRVLYVDGWVFRQDGTITVAVGATGVAQVKGVPSRIQADTHAARDTAWGHRVAEHTVAINHDHFFSFRLDLDVDGRRNSFVLDRLQTLRVEDLSPRKSSVRFRTSVSRLSAS